MYKWIYKIPNIFCTWQMVEGQDSEAVQVRVPVGKSAATTHFDTNNTVVDNITVSDLSKLLTCQQVANYAMKNQEM